MLSVLNGTWERPAAFPVGVYETLIYPDVFFIPLYLASAILLYRRHRLGIVASLVACGGIIYAMIDLLALSKLSGTLNLAADSMFLVLSLASVGQMCAVDWRSTTG